MSDKQKHNSKLSKRPQIRRNLPRRTAKPFLQRLKAEGIIQAFVAENQYSTSHYVTYAIWTTRENNVQAHKLINVYLKMNQDRNYVL